MYVCVQFPELKQSVTRQYHTTSWTEEDWCTLVGWRYLNDSGLERSVKLQNRLWESKIKKKWCILNVGEKNVHYKRKFFSISNVFQNKWAKYNLTWEWTYHTSLLPFDPYQNPSSAWLLYFSSLKGIGHRRIVLMSGIKDHMIQMKMNAKVWKSISRKTNVWWTDFDKEP